MKRRFFIKTGILGTLSLMANAPTVLAGNPPTILPFRSFKTPSPRAYQSFHQSNRFCRVRGGDIQRAWLSSREKAYLQNINEDVNSSISYQSENRDDWSVSGVTGDCEDYALRKLQTFMQDQMISRNNLSLAVCQSEEKILHAVLLLHCLEGDYVLDNRFDHITPWHRLPYRWLAMEKHSDWKNFNLITVGKTRS